MSLQIQIDVTSARFTCDNCKWEGRHDQIEESISDPSERLNAGCITPAGTCPDCNALVYYTDETAPAWTGQGELHKLKAERAQLVAALRGVMPYAESRLEDMEDSQAELDAGDTKQDADTIEESRQCLHKARAAFEAARGVLALAGKPYPL